MQHPFGCFKLSRFLEFDELGEDSESETKLTSDKETKDSDSDATTRLRTIFFGSCGVVSEFKVVSVDDLELPLSLSKLRFGLYAISRAISGDRFGDNGLRRFLLFSMFPSGVRLRFARFGKIPGRAGSERKLFRRRLSAKETRCELGLNSW